MKTLLMLHPHFQWYQHFSAILLLVLFSSLIFVIPHTMYIGQSSIHIEVHHYHHQVSGLGADKLCVFRGHSGNNYVYCSTLQVRVATTTAA